MYRPCRYSHRRHEKAETAANGCNGETAVTTNYVIKNLNSELLSEVKSKSKAIPVTGRGAL
jgi:hypothetical protein